MQKSPENLSLMHAAARLSMLSLSPETSPIGGAHNRIVAWMDEPHDLKTNPLHSETVPYSAPDAPPAACGAASLRQDEIGESLPLALALQNAKSTHADFIVVPGALEREGGQ